MPAGRPTKLTPEVQATICKYVAAGVSYADAARLAGVGETTLHRWRTKGKSARSGNIGYFGCMSRPPWRSSDPPPRTCSSWRAMGTAPSGRTRSARPRSLRWWTPRAETPGTGTPRWWRRRSAPTGGRSPGCGSAGRPRAPYMCTRPPLVAPHTSPSRRPRKFPLPVAPTRANVDGRRLPAAATKEEPSP